MTTPARVTHVQTDGVGFAFLRPATDFLDFIAGTLDAVLNEGLGAEQPRRAERVPMGAAIVFSAGGRTAGAQLRDLSATGAFVVTDSPPPLGTETLIYFPGYAYSDGSNEVSELRGCFAEVVRHAADGFGCRFLRPSAEFKMALHDVLDAQRGGTG